MKKIPRISVVFFIKDLAVYKNLGLAAKCTPPPPNFYIKISVVLLSLKILRFSVVFYIKIPVVLSSIKKYKGFQLFFIEEFMLMFTSNFIRFLSLILGREN